MLLVLWIGLCLWAQRHSDEELATSWGLSRPLSPRHPPQEPVSAPSPCSNKARRPAFREGSGCLCPGRPWWFTWQGPGAQRLRTQVSELTGHGVLAPGQLSQRQTPSISCSLLLFPGTWETDSLCPKALLSTHPSFPSTKNLASWGHLSPRQTGTTGPSV